MPDVHARFSPSSAEQFINCPPSLVLEEQCNIADETSEYAAEGTEAHTLCEYLIRTELGGQMEDPRLRLSRYGTEMQECAEGYRNAVMEIYKKGETVLWLKSDIINWNDKRKKRAYKQTYFPESYTPFTKQSELLTPREMEILVKYVNGEDSKPRKRGH